MRDMLMYPSNAGLVKMLYFLLTKRCANLNAIIKSCVFKYYPLNHVNLNTIYNIKNLLRVCSYPLLFQFQGLLPSSDDGSLIIDTGRCILLPMTVNPCSTRQFPDDPVTIEIIEGEPDEDDPSLSSSNDDVKPERVAYITTTVPWEVSIPEEKALVRHHSPSLNTTGYENVRKTYNLMNTKTLLKVGYIDLGLRLTCMGTNIWNRLKKMNKFKQQSSESDRSPIISEPQTEDENGNHRYIFLIQFSTSYQSNLILFKFY